MALTLKIRDGESIRVGAAVIRMRRRGNKVTLEFYAPAYVTITRLGVVEDPRAAPELARHMLPAKEDQ